MNFSGRFVAMVMLVLGCVVGCGGEDEPQVTGTSETSHGVKHELSVHRLRAELASPDSPVHGDDNLVVTDTSDGSAYEVMPATLTPKDLGPLEMVEDADDEKTWAVRARLTEQGRQKFRDLTAQAACGPPGDRTRGYVLVLKERISLAVAWVKESVVCGEGEDLDHLDLETGMTRDDAESLVDMLTADTTTDS